MSGYANTTQAETTRALSRAVGEIWTLRERVLEDATPECSEVIADALYVAVAMIELAAAAASAHRVREDEVRIARSMRAAITGKTAGKS